MNSIMKRSRILLEIPNLFGLKLKLPTENCSVRQTSANSEYDLRPNFCIDFFVPL